MRASNRLLILCAISILLTACLLTAASPFKQAEVIHRNIADIDQNKRSLPMPFAIGAAVLQKRDGALPTGEEDPVDPTGAQKDKRALQTPDVAAGGAGALQKRDGPSPTATLAEHGKRSLPTPFAAGAAGLQKRQDPERTGDDGPTKGKRALQTPDAAAGGAGALQERDGPSPTATLAEHGKRSLPTPFAAGAAGLQKREERTEDDGPTKGKRALQTPDVAAGGAGALQKRDGPSPTATLAELGKRALPTPFAAGVLQKRHEGQPAARRNE